MQQYREDEEEKQDPSILDRLSQASNEAYEKRKQLLASNLAISKDKFAMDMNPNLQGPRQDSSIFAKPLPVQSEYMNSEITPMVTAGSITSGGAGKAFQAAREKGLSEMAGAKQWTTEGLQALKNKAQEIAASPTVSQVDKSMVFQKLRNALNTARTRGVKLPEGE